MVPDVVDVAPPNERFHGGLLHKRLLKGTLLPKKPGLGEI